MLATRITKCSLHSRMFSTLRDPYDVLGVSRTTSHDDIKVRFRELAKEFHPDLNTHDPEAPAKMADITNAYDILTDKRKRADWDRSNTYGNSSSSSSADRSGPRSEWVDPSQMFSEFSNVFGRMNRHRPVGRVAQRGDDIGAQVEVELVDSMVGATKTLNIKSKQCCSQCAGSGARKGTGLSSCKTCKGTGTQRVERGIMTMGMPCVRCGGSGQTIEHPCVGCKGEGTRIQPVEVLVKIPAGIKNQMELRLQGHGHSGSRGGRSGDLFVTVRIKPDPYFTLIDNDVHVDIQLSFKQVIFGTNIMVKRIDGKSVMNVHIPPGTVPGTTQVLLGKGPPKPSTSASHGDMVLRFLLKVPSADSLTAQQKLLIDQLE